MRLKLLFVLLYGAALSSPVMAQHGYGSYGSRSRPTPGTSRHTGLTNTRVHSGRRTDVSGAHERRHALHFSNPPSARTSLAAQGMHGAGSSSMGPRRNLGSQLNNSSAIKTGSGLASPQGRPMVARSRQPQAPDTDDHSSVTDQRLQSELSRKGGAEHHSQGTMSRSSATLTGNMGKRPSGSHPAASGNRSSGHQ
jgi:hypothetical protein